MPAHSGPSIILVRRRRGSDVASAAVRSCLATSHFGDELDQVATPGGNQQVAADVGDGTYDQVQNQGSMRVPKVVPVDWPARATGRAPSK